MLATDIEDHPDNSTRFVVVSRTGIPAPSGHDKTSVVIFQRTDRPGSLLTILQEFAARSINLTKLESRPTKQGLGNYCFLIDLEGHIGDELVADCLRTLKSKVEDVKFLGSFPRRVERGPALRRDAEAACARRQRVGRRLAARSTSTPASTACLDAPARVSSLGARRFPPVPVRGRASAGSSLRCPAVPCQKDRELLACPGAVAEWTKARS